MKLVATTTGTNSGIKNTVWMRPCVIWVPRFREQVVLNALILLQQDPSVYSRLTTDQTIVFVYSGRIRMANNGGRIYGISEAYFLWGRDGVASLLAQSLFMLEASSSINQVRITKSSLAAIKLVPEKVLDWMNRNSIRQDYREAYREIIPEHLSTYSIGRVVIGT